MKIFISTSAAKVNANLALRKAYKLDVRKNNPIELASFTTKQVSSLENKDDVVLVQAVQKEVDQLHKLFVLFRSKLPSKAVLMEDFKVSDVKFAQKLSTLGLKSPKNLIKELPSVLKNTKLMERYKDHLDEFLNKNSVRKFINSANTLNLIKKKMVVRRKWHDKQKFEANKPRPIVKPGTKKKTPVKLNEFGKIKATIKDVQTFVKEHFENYNTTQRDDKTIVWLNSGNFVKLAIDKVEKEGFKYKSGEGTNQLFLNRDKGIKMSTGFELGNPRQPRSRHFVEFSPMHVYINSEIEDQLDQIRDEKNVVPKSIDTDKPNKVYYYGLTIRPPGLGSVPKGHVEIISKEDSFKHDLTKNLDKRFFRHGIIGYPTKLSDREVEHYSFYDLEQGLRTKEKRAEGMKELANLVQREKQIDPNLTAKNFFDDFIKPNGDMLEYNPFKDRNGKYDTKEIIQAFKESGFTGPIPLASEKWFESL